MESNARGMVRHHMPRYHYCLIAISFLCGHVGISAAQPADSPITLLWEVPAGSECPAANVVSAEVERLLGGKPGTNSGRRLIIRAIVARNEDGSWTLTMRTANAGEEPDGERLLHAPSCEELASAAALIIALGFDPAAVAAQAGRTREQAPDVADDPADVAPKTPEAAPKQPAIAQPIVAGSSDTPPQNASSPPPHVEKPARLRFGVNVGVGGDIGSFSEPAYSVHLAARLQYRKFSVVATGAYFPPYRTPVKDRPTVGGTFSLITGGLSACVGLFSFRALDVGVYGGAEMGQMRAEGYGVSEPTTGSSLWFAPIAGGTAAVGLTAALGLRLNVGVAVPLARYRFVLEPIGVVHEPAAITARANIGLEYHF